jgi:Sulfotransferase domain
MVRKVRLVEWLNKSGLGVFLSWIRKFKKNTYILSYPKCGRTWAATVMMHYVGKTKGVLDEAQDFALNPNRARPDLFRLNRAAVFTHDISTRQRTSEQLAAEFSLEKYMGNPLVFLVRDPRDVLVSFYYHNLKRIHKTGLPSGTTMDEFVRMPKYGLERLITYYNLSAKNAKIQDNIRFFRYEDLRGGGAYNLESWREMFEFIFQTPIDLGALQWSLEINSFDKMKKREHQLEQNKNTDFEEKSDDLRRVRRGKIGGYKSEMQNETLHYVNDYIEEHLDDFFDFYKGL